MNPLQPFPWREAIGFGLGVLRLSPAQFSAGTTGVNGGVTLSDRLLSLRSDVAVTTITARRLLFGRWLASLDPAIVETLRNGGDVLPLGDRGSGDSPLAAAYRYPA